jgi:hypothetical protein
LRSNPFLSSRPHILLSGSKLSPESARRDYIIGMRLDDEFGTAYANFSINAMRRSSLMRRTDDHWIYSGVVETMGFSFWTAHDEARIHLHYQRTTRP